MQFLRLGHTIALQMHLDESRTCWNSFCGQSAQIENFLNEAQRLGSCMHNFRVMIWSCTSTYLCAGMPVLVRFSKPVQGILMSEVWWFNISNFIFAGECPRLMFAAISQSQRSNKRSGSLLVQEGFVLGAQVVQIHPSSHNEFSWCWQTGFVMTFLKSNEQSHLVN